MLSEASKDKSHIPNSADTLPANSEKMAPTIMGADAELVCDKVAGENENGSRQLCATRRRAAALRALKRSSASCTGSESDVQLEVLKQWQARCAPAGNSSVESERILFTSWEMRTLNNSILTRI